MFIAETTTFWKNGVVEAFCHKRVRVISNIAPPIFRRDVIVDIFRRNFRSMWRHNSLFSSSYISQTRNESTFVSCLRDVRRGEERVVTSHWPKISTKDVDDDVTTKNWGCDVGNDSHPFVAKGFDNSVFSKRCCLRNKHSRKLLFFLKPVVLSWIFRIWQPQFTAGKSLDSVHVLLVRCILWYLATLTGRHFAAKFYFSSGSSAPARPQFRNSHEYHPYSSNWYPNFLWNFTSKSRVKIFEAKNEVVDIFCEFLTL